MGACSLIQAVLLLLFFVFLPCLFRQLFHSRFDELIRNSDALRQFMVRVGVGNVPSQRGPAADRQYNCPITGEVMEEPCKECVMGWWLRFRHCFLSSFLAPP